MKKNNFFSLNLPDKIFGLDKSFLFLFVPPLILVVLFLVSLNLVLLPKVTEIGEVNKKTEEVKASTKKITTQNKYLMSIDQEELKKNAEYLDNAVLRDKKSYLLVSIIRQVANNFDYQVQGFSLTPGEIKSDETDSTIKVSSSGGDAIKMPVNLSVIGPKEKSLDFIMALEKTLPILFIDKFETKAVGGMSQLNLTVSSYYVGDKTNMDTNNVTLEELTLSDEESSLIKRISNFNKIENNQAGVGTTEFKIYERQNPFSI